MLSGIALVSSPKDTWRGPAYRTVSRRKRVGSADLRACRPRKASVPTFEEILIPAPMTWSPRSLTKSTSELMSASDATGIRRQPTTPISRAPFPRGSRRGDRGGQESWALLDLIDDGRMVKRQLDLGRADEGVAGLVNLVRKGEPGRRARRHPRGECCAGAPGRDGR